MAGLNHESQMRKVQLTINNPEEHGYTHIRIREELGKMKSCIFWIMADEVGGKDGTYHTHIYVVFKTPVRFSTIKNRFPTAHIEKAVSTHASNINYVKKEGKWKDTEKGATSVSGTIEQWGTCPPDAVGTDEKLIELYTYIKEGLTDYEILEKSSDYLFDVDKIRRVRQLLMETKFQDEFRQIECIYVFGETNTNKTRTYMEKYGYRNVYRVTNYVGNAVWDGYKGQDVVIFEEYRSQILISEMLTWTEGYPNCCLRARYNDKVACFTKVIFISNIPLEKQYPNVQEESPETWRAFLRRIQKVVHHKSRDEIITYNSVEDYFNRNREFHPPTSQEEKEIQEAFPDTLPFE